MRSEPKPHIGPGLASLARSGSVLAGSPAAQVARQALEKPLRGAPTRSVLVKQPAAALRRAGLGSLAGPGGVKKLAGPLRADLAKAKGQASRLKAAGSSTKSAATKTKALGSAKAGGADLARIASNPLLRAMSGGRRWPK